MRLKLFMRCDSTLDVGEESVSSFQNRVNTWLQKVRRHPQYRIVNQSICVGAADKIEYAEIIVSIWYEKVPRKE